MHVTPPPSHFAAWRALETRLDRWASFTALGLGVAAFVVVLSLQIVS